MYGSSTRVDHYYDCLLVWLLHDMTVFSVRTTIDVSNHRHLGQPGPRCLDREYWPIVFVLWAAAPDLQLGWWGHSVPFSCWLFRIPPVQPFCPKGNAARGCYTLHSLVHWRQCNRPMSPRQQPEISSQTWLKTTSRRIRCDTQNPSSPHLRRKTLHFDITLEYCSRTKSLLASLWWKQKILLCNVTPFIICVMSWILRATSILTYP